ncbi:hypothetical protein ASE74_12235 [Pedobacter sp. Leaf216]|uniref:hypothetical protein n=1 Tax=Pedobacter sp. Leaf216 TaxID=1735684 RepID=UPI0006F673BC|nr:hypothetical protein [Pedobacter sp. Leaf216]KQM63931.1 hypothetical protein ASE74_12235 [Pedobacter sp. Leaf216]
MKKQLCAIVFFLLIFSSFASAQWAASSDGNCLYDVFGNLVPNSCQTDIKCKYKDTGTSRKNCFGVPTPFGCFGFEYTEKLFITECPLDDLVNPLYIILGTIVFLNLRNRKHL